MTFGAYCESTQENHFEMVKQEILSSFKAHICILSSIEIRGSILDSTSNLGSELDFATSFLSCIFL